jgi:uncharacterized protein
MLLDTLLGAALGRLAPGMPILEIGLITGATLSVLVSVALWRLGWWREVGFRAPADARALLWFLPFLLYGLLPLGAGLRATTAGIVPAAAAGLAIAFWKLAVLGLLVRAFQPHGVWRAAAVAAVLYALLHLGSLLVGAAVGPTRLLSLSYLLLAFGFAAVRLRTGLLWPLVGCYALLLTTAAATQDVVAPNLAPSIEAIAPAVAVSLLLALYGVFALRRTG